LRLTDDRRRRLAYPSPITHLLQCLSCNTFIAVMETANLRNFDNSPSP
jgi:hypothetical protein